MELHVYMEIDACTSEQTGIALISGGKIHCNLPRNRIWMHLLWTFLPNVPIFTSLRRVLAEGSAGWSRPFQVRCGSQNILFSSIYKTVSSVIQFFFKLLILLSLLMIFP